MGGGSLNESGAVAGAGVDFYQWLLGVLRSARAGGGGGGGGGGRRGYRRLDQPAVRKRVRLARLGKRRVRALRRIKRFRLAWFSPLTLLDKLRDAYVKLLQSASHKLSYTEGLALGPFPGFPSADAPTFGDLKAKEREMDRVLALYLSRTTTTTRPPPQLLLTHDDVD